MHLFKRAALVSICLSLLLCTACGPSESRAQSERGNQDTSSGSSSVSPLSPVENEDLPGKEDEDPENPGVTYSAADAKSIKDKTPRIDGSIMTIPITEGISEMILGMDHDTATKTSVHTGSLGAYEKLASGEADIIFVTYPSKEEKEHAVSLGLVLDYIPIARDGLVFVVNSANELSDIPLQSIKDIYSGKTTSWKDLTKSNDKITAYQSPSNSYMQTLLLNLVMSDIPPMIPPMRKVTTEQNIVADVVSSYNNTADAIGFSSYYYLVGSYGEADQKMLSVDGVLPTPETISNGTYPLSCDIYAAIPSDTDQSEGASLLIGWLLSEEGQRMISQSGYIPLYALDSEVTS